MRACVRVCACVRACARACVRARVRARVCACARVRVNVGACVRACKLKTNHHKWNDANMQLAMRGKVTCSEKSWGSSVLLSSLGFPAPPCHEDSRECEMLLLQQKRVWADSDLFFSPAIELELVAHIKRMESMLFGFTLSQLKSVAEANDIMHNFNRWTGEAGKDWCHDLMASHSDEIYMRTPEPTSAARTRAFNEGAGNTFFDLLETVQDTKRFTPDRVYNVDETGITTVPNRLSKIIASRGKKHVGHCRLLRGVEISMSAAGTFIPPLFIFPRKRMKDKLTDCAPPASIAIPHETGWMQSHIFVMWFEHFLKPANPPEARSVLLILDGHKKHTNNLPFIDLARANFVTVICLPLHCSHRMQPLDVSSMKPLMTYYTHCWLRSHPGRVVSTFQITELFGIGYVRVATMRRLPEDRHMAD